jgi:predicted transcriptional regulator
MPVMTQKKPAGEKLVINARVDAHDVERLDNLAAVPGTVNFQRSRSELIGFAIREYVDRHASKPGKAK